MLDRQQGFRTAEDVGTRVRGWVNHVSYANSIGLRKAVFRDAARMAGARTAAARRLTA